MYCTFSDKSLVLKSPQTMEIFSFFLPRIRLLMTFNDKSYLGNLLLSGPLTKRNCEGDKKNTEEAGNSGEEEETDIDMLVLYWTRSSTYGTVSIGILVLMCFDCLWRLAWLRLVDVFVTSVKYVPVLK